MKTCMRMGCDEPRVPGSAYCEKDGGVPPATAPDAAHARRTDPQTSHDAARSVMDLNGKQTAVLTVIRQQGPMTDQEIAAAYRRTGGPKQSASGLRTRRAELVAAGLVIDSGARSATDSGRLAVVWAFTNPDSKSGD